MAKDKQFEAEYKAERLRRTKARKRKRKDKKGSHLDCPKCGHYVGYYVGYKINPYYKEMNDMEIKERMCSDCYDSAVGDI